ncbi:MAG: hypothetical protein K2K70_14430 [Lachnospiraceae bacterium]|nr:hypothetical protein [Lachnospiraceae bacterium]
MEISWTEANNEHILEFERNLADILHAHLTKPMDVPLLLEMMASIWNA